MWLYKLFLYLNSKIYGKIGSYLNASEILFTCQKFSFIQICKRFEIRIYKFPATILRKYSKYPLNDFSLKLWIWYL